MRGFALFACATIALVLCSELAEAARSSNWREWQLYKRKYGKVYDTPEEDARRFGLFMKSKAELHSLQDSAVTYRRGINHLSDWTEEEFKRMLGFRAPVGDSGLEAARANSPEAEGFLREILASDEPVPTEVDWRKVPGRVSKVKDQGPCGSCWAFAAVGVLEGQEMAGEMRNLTELSSQGLVDCSTSNTGCDGGLVDSALDDIADMGGIEREQDYPYISDQTGKKGKCAFSRAKSVMSCRGSLYPPPYSEEIIKLLVVRYGPVSAAIDGTNLASYDSGIYQGNHCKNTSLGLNHAVLIVGYGTDPSSGDFWIVKNSWSDLWGEKGYFRITRGHNTCGISVAPVVAVF